MARQALTTDQVEQKREEILEAALSLFEKDGLEAVSLRNIAASLGVSYSAPYRYFPSKDALVTGMRAQAFRDMTAELQKAQAQCPTPREALSVLAQGFFDSALERPRRYALMFFRVMDEDIGPRSQELAIAKREALNVCTLAVAAAQARGELRSDVDALTISHILWTGMHGLISLQIAGQYTLGRNATDLMPKLIDSLLQGFTARH